jgi:4-hydroxy-3-methylbut-2-enyl diphosphate reductase
MVDKIILASPRGFCAGVSRAIDIVEKALNYFGAPVYVRHEIVHNKHVVEDLKRKGAVFVEELNEVPANSIVIFSAHGVSPAIKEEAKCRNLKTVDATCPLVTKVHWEAIKYKKEDYELVLIGHKGHPEVEGTMGEAPMHLVETVEDVQNLQLNGKIAVLTQTTLSVDETKDIMEALRTKFGNISMPPREDICYATTNRQNAAKELAKKCELVLVIGSQNSSNSKRLVETAQKAGTKGALINDKNEVKEEWLNHNTIGITSGASAPEKLVQEIVEFFKTKNGKLTIEHLETAKENTVFPLPRELTA